MDEDNNKHELTMVAENLGKIPPNTSLMIVESGGQRFEVRITSTEKCSSEIQIPGRKVSVSFHFQIRSYCCRCCNFLFPLHIIIYFSTRMRRQIIIIVLLLSGLFTGAQDINGIWKGKIVMAPSGCFPVYNIELQLQVAGTRITGTAYHFSDSLNYIKENFEGNYNRDSNLIIIKEIGIVTFKIKETVSLVSKLTLSPTIGEAEM